MASLLIVDDDTIFCETLQESFIRHGHEVECAHNAHQALLMASQFIPEWALVDLNMPEISGLALIPQLLEIDPATRIVVLTGYATITTAIEAIKLGAIHYLAKPVSTGEIIAAFHKQEGNPHVPITVETTTLSAAERDHILQCLMRNNHNISAAARELGMHRRTLQRKLDKLRI